MGAIEKITEIPGVVFTPPSGGWEGQDASLFHADMSLLGFLRERARRSVSDPRAANEPASYVRTQIGDQVTRQPLPCVAERLLRLRDIPEQDLRFEVRRVERTWPHWRLAGSDDQSTWDRLDRHFEIPHERARGLISV